MSSISKTSIVLRILIRERINQLQTKFHVSTNTLQAWRVFENASEEMILLTGYKQLEKEEEALFARVVDAYNSIMHFTKNYHVYYKPMVDAFQIILQTVKTFDYPMLLGLDEVHCDINPKTLEEIILLKEWDKIKHKHPWEPRLWLLLRFLQDDEIYKEERWKTYRLWAYREILRVFELVPTTPAFCPLLRFSMKVNFMDVRARAIVLMRKLIAIDEPNWSVAAVLEDGTQICLGTIFKSVRPGSGIYWLFHLVRYDYDNVCSICLEDSFNFMVGFTWMAFHRNKFKPWLQDDDVLNGWPKLKDHPDYDSACGPLKKLAESLSAFQ